MNALTGAAGELIGLGSGGHRGRELESLAVHQYFDAQTVVSRDAQGHTVSLYGDDAWDFSSASLDGRSGAVLRFFTQKDAKDPKLAATIQAQQKALVWLHIDAGNVRALGTIQSVNRAARTWCQVAYDRGMSFFELLCSPETMAEACESLNTNYLGLMSSLVGTLWRHRHQLCVESEVPLQRLRATIQRVASNRPEHNQTPLIPSRIYCGILSGLIAQMDQIERDLDKVLDAYRLCMRVPRSLPGGVGRDKRRWARLKATEPAARHMERLGYEAGAGRTVDRFLAGQFNYYQAVLMHTLAAFTGMRAGEVKLLPLRGVLDSFVDAGFTHYVINGYTHKLHGGVRTKTAWITSNEGHRAVVLAQRIAEAILEELQLQPALGQEPRLFPSTGDSFKFKNNNTIGTYQRRLTEAVCLPVTQDDLDELDRLELSRGWQRDDIVVGRPWPLAFHQLRRSLSVYAHRSGMVSLPSLKAQLQHITDEMRAYYSDGFSRAVNLVFDKDHFSHEWNAAKAESSFFGYAMALLFPSEDLWGQGAARMAQTFANRSREETLQLFKRGDIAYRETVLGGCVSTEECKSQPLEPIPFDCLESNGVNLVVVPKRLEQVIRSQQSVVATLESEDSGSVEHRLEANNLRVLLKARQTLGGPKP